jgi:hypothetical protein
MQQASQSKHELIRNPRQNQQDRESESSVPHAARISNGLFLHELFQPRLKPSQQCKSKENTKSSQNDSLGLHCMLNTTIILSIMI